MKTVKFKNSYTLEREKLEAKYGKAHEEIRKQIGRLGRSFKRLLKDPNSTERELLESSTLLTDMHWVGFYISDLHYGNKHDWKVKRMAKKRIVNRFLKEAA